MIFSYKSVQNNNTLIRGAAALTLSVMIVKVIGFIYKLPLSRILGDEGMGYFNSAYSVFTFFYMICQGGIPRAVSISVTEAKLKDGEQRASQIFRACFFAFTLIGVISTALMISFSSVLSRVIGNSLAKMSLCCIAPSLTFVSASGVLRGYLNGNGKMLEIAIAEVLDGIIKFVFGMFFALIACKNNFSIPMISAYTILGVTMGSFFGSLFMFLCAIRAKNKKIDVKSKQNRQSLSEKLHTFKKVLYVSLPMTLSSAVIGFSSIIDLGMIMHRLVDAGMSEREAIALYGNFTTLAVPMINLLSSLVNPLSASAMPHLTASFTLGKEEEYAELCQKILLLTSLISAPVSAFYAFFSQEILSLLFNSKSALTAAPLLSLISPSAFLLPLLTVVNTFLESSKRQRIPLTSMTFGCILKLICGYFLIGRLGIKGAPISTCICYLCALSVSAMFIQGGHKEKTTFIKPIIIPLIFAYFTVGGASLLRVLLDLPSLTRTAFIIFGFLTAAVYGLSVMLFYRKEIKKYLIMSKLLKTQRKHYENGRKKQENV